MYLEDWVDLPGLMARALLACPPQWWVDELVAAEEAGSWSAAMPQ